ncbi:MAG: TolC family outer membrane protein, partial [Inhella sp.]
LAGGAVQAQILNELYQAARAYDATYLSARATAESVQYKLMQAEALRKPTLGVGAGATHTQTDPPAVYQTINGQRVQVAGDRVGTTNVNAGLKASLSLYNRANGLTINQAERGVAKAGTALEAAEQDLMVRVSQAYFDVLAAREALTLAQANKRAIGEQLASAKRNFEVGTATITDTREAQSRFDLSTATEIAAENDLRVKSVFLDQLVGRTGVDPKPLALPIALPALEPLNVDPWLTQAEESPAVRLARIDLETAQLEVEKAGAANAPTVDMTASLGGQDLSGRGASPKGFTSSGSVGVQFTLPLYTGGYNEARKQETLKLQEKARNDLEAARRTAAERTRSAFLGRQSLQAQVKALESAEASAKLALEATQLGYKVGVRVNLDVLNAQAQLNNTQNSLAKARFDTIMTGLRLRQAAGQLRPEDVAALDALLAK